MTLREFSSISCKILGFETPILPLCTSTTVSIEFSKLRKSNQRFVFLKFTLCECSRFDYYMAIALHKNFYNHRRGALRAPALMQQLFFIYTKPFLYQFGYTISSKSQILRTREQNRYVPLAERFERIFAAKLIKSFCQAFFKKRKSLSN